MPPKKASLLDDKRVAVLVNPKSAKGRWEKDLKARAYIHRVFGGRVYDRAGTKVEMIETARRLSLENDVLIALGGDGTVADAMQGIFNAGRQKDVILGIIPFGSGNALSRSLQLSLSLKNAVRAIRYGTPRVVDVIDIGGRIASFVSVGATGLVTYRTSQSKVPGLVGHLLASRILFTHPRHPMQISLFDGRDDAGVSFERKDLDLKVFDVIINKTNHFGYSWLIAPKAKIDDGYLDVTVFDIRALTYVWYFPLIYLGIYQKLLKHYKVRRIEIHGGDLHAQYNGEAIEKRESFEMNVIHKALRVIGPRTVDKKRPNRTEWIAGDSGF
ncbi:MAG: Diacylglycerol kinase [Candidatus Aminicenantes bacterium ADurb.Bin147]|nr:MAG: Diacylglycerol kinase [Candidatus Aminicenantes bacterium ADurb.Bin147]